MKNLTNAKEKTNFDLQQHLSDNYSRLENFHFQIHIYAIFT